MDIALSLLVWVDRYATRIQFQDLPPFARRKNRVILQFRGPYSRQIETVGACTLPQAIAKANHSPAFQPPRRAAVVNPPSTAE